MSALAKEGSGAERLLRSICHRKGLRFRINSRPVPALRCHADLVFAKSMVCVFFDGCFWHGCPTHFSPPHSNSEWWVEKINDNRRRDKRQRRILQQNGWCVVRVWEHEFPATAASRIEAAVRNRLPCG
jgi:DNA mismatch endonuclease (patch repair protein)